MPSWLAGRVSSLTTCGWRGRSSAESSARRSVRPARRDKQAAQQRQPGVEHGPQQPAVPASMLPAAMSSSRVNARCVRLSRQQGPLRRPVAAPRGAGPVGDRRPPGAGIVQPSSAAEASRGRSSHAAASAKPTSARSSRAAVDPTPLRPFTSTSVTSVRQAASGGAPTSLDRRSWTTRGSRCPPAAVLAPQRAATPPGGVVTAAASRRPYGIQQRGTLSASAPAAPGAGAAVSRCSRGHAPPLGRPRPGRRSRSGPGVREGWSRGFALSWAPGGRVRAAARRQPQPYEPGDLLVVEAGAERSSAKTEVRRTCSSGGDPSGRGDRPQSGHDEQPDVDWASASVTASSIRPGQVDHDDPTAPPGGAQDGAHRLRRDDDGVAAVPGLRTEKRVVRGRDPPGLRVDPARESARSASAGRPSVRHRADVEAAAEGVAVDRHRAAAAARGGDGECAGRGCWRRRRHGRDDGRPSRQVRRRPPRRRHPVGDQLRRRAEKHMVAADTAKPGARRGRHISWSRPTRRPRLRPALIGADHVLSCPTRSLARDRIADAAEAVGEPARRSASSRPWRRRRQHLACALAVTAARGRLRTMLVDATPSAAASTSCSVPNRRRPGVARPPDPGAGHSGALEEPCPHPRALLLSWTAATPSSSLRRRCAPSWAPPGGAVGIVVVDLPRRWTTPSRGTWPRSDVGLLVVPPELRGSPRRGSLR